MISFEALKQIKRLLAPISRRINGLVSRAMIRAVNAEGVNLTLLAGEQTGLMPLLQEFGLASTPPPGAQAIALFINGDRSHGHVIATDDARYRPRDIESGMAALYSLLDGLGVGEELSEGMSEGQAMHSVRLKPGRVVEINGTSAQIIMNGTPLNITAAGGIVSISAPGVIHINSMIIPALGEGGSRPAEQTLSADLVKIEANALQISLGGKTFSFDSSGMPARIGTDTAGGDVIAEG